jgi:hypothetical protein
LNPIRAVVGILHHRFNLFVKCSSEAIAKAHCLTPTELRALVAIVELGGISEVAEAMGSPGPPLGRISAAFTNKSAPDIRLISLKSLPASPIRSAADRSGRRVLPAEDVPWVQICKVLGNQTGGFGTPAGHLVAAV